MRIIQTFRNRYVIAIDLLITVATILGSYLLRLEWGSLFLLYLPSAYFMIGTALIVKPLVYSFFGLYRRLWVYASLNELKLILIAVTAASALVAAAMSALFYLGAFTGFPRSALVIDWVLSILCIGGFRVAIRVLAEATRINNNAVKRRGGKKKAIIIGAGDAGALIVREMQKNPQLNLEPIGFLDDNPDKQRKQLYNLPILGAVSDLPRVLDSHTVDEVIIAIPSAPGRVVRLVADVCRLKGIPFRTMPGLYELLGGKVNISRLREVEISDLLRRQPTRMNDEKIGEVITGKTVLVTGAGGSIGRELCRQIARWEPGVLIMLGHGENSVFEAYLELHGSFPTLAISPVIADVKDKDRLKQVFAEFHPQVVFHAAAHKHVPLMESNVEEAISNNIGGTKALVDVCLANNIERLVMISTDKAIRPVNVMGATKRMAEMIVLDAAAKSGKPYEVVRFGNVLGSRGSVVPLFKRQIALGGPVTITHPDMKRYFMTIPEAVYLVLQAASLGQGGDAFLLNMGEQVRILDLAEDLIRLSGLEPGKDIEIVFTGVRPGEKLSEDLWEQGKQFQPTSHPEIYRLEGQEGLQGAELQKAVKEILGLAEKGDRQALLAKLEESIPGCHIQANANPELISID